MGNLSLGQAAKEANVSKATISKALKNGRLSYVAKSTAGYEIDPAELFRVFPKKPLETVVSERSQTPEETAEKASLAVEVRMLRERLAEVQEERDAWRDQAQRLALPAPDQPKRRGWFGR